MLADNRNRISVTLGIPEFPSQVFPFCRSPRRHCHHPRQKHRYTGGGRRAACAESFRATICPTLSPSVLGYPSVEKAVTRVRHTPTSRCFLTVSENSACPGRSRSRKASRGVSASLDPTSIERSQVSGRDAIWSCRAWMTVRIENILKTTRIPRTRVLR